MAVQVWIGEKPENHNERRALTQLATSLARLDGLYIIIANFSVGGRTIDLVVLKREGFFVIELKHCDGIVIGDVNGPWFVENANKERKRINPGRKNPYNQVISYYYALTNFLNDHKSAIVGHRSVETRSVRRVVAIRAHKLPPTGKCKWSVSTSCPSFCLLSTRPTCSGTKMNSNAFRPCSTVCVGTKLNPSCSPISRHRQ